MSMLRIAVRLALLTLAWPALGQPPCASCPTPSLGPAARAFSTRYDGQPPYTGGPVSEAVVGDFNGDGIPDVVAGGSLFLGTGSGSLLPAKPLPYSGGDSTVAADFDGDGNLDLATTGAVVLLGDGKGGFRVRQSSLPFGVSYLAVGDFNGDGISDLATANYYGNDLAILRGVGDGTFVLAQSLKIGSGNGPFSHLVPRVGDFNGDGIDDIAVASRGDGRIGIVLGGAGGPAAVIDVPTGFSYGGALLVGDFDGDGKLDLLAEGTTSFGSSKTLFSLLGNGDGTFRAGSSLVSGYSAVVQIGDFTGDGKLDVAMIRPYDSDTMIWGLFVYPGTGGGAFGAPVRTQTTGGATNGFALTPLVAADLDLDGRLDLVVPEYTGEAVTILRGRGDGHFDESPSFSTGVQRLEGIAIADFNNDGRPDVVVSAFIYGQVAVLPGDGAGGFQAPLVASTPSIDGGPVVADFDGDGNMDVAVSDGFEDIYVLLGNGDGSFGPPIRTEKIRGQGVLASADFDGDGKPDLIFDSLVASGVFFFKGNGDGTFQPAQTLTQAAAASLFVGDVNADGKADVVYTTYTVFGTSLEVLLGGGDGTFSGPVTTPLDGGGSGLALEDVNGDGKPDMIVSLRNAVGVLLGDDTGHFAPPILTESQGYPRQATLADLNGDGLIDLAIAEQDHMQIFPGLGDGHFGRRRLYTMPGTPIAAVSGRFHAGATLPDIVVAFNGSVYTPPDFVAVLSNTSCLPRRLSFAVDAPACVPPGAPLAPAPVVHVLDDADNVVACASGAVSASIVPGTGTPGAVLSGTTSVPLASGAASFGDLSIDRTGRGYALEFRNMAGATRTRPFRVGSVPPVAISGPAAFCASATYAATPGFETYAWSVDGLPVGGGTPLVLDGHAIGSGVHTLELAAKEGGCAAMDAIPIRVTLPDVRITAPATACPLVDGVAVSVPDAGTGALYAWTITNGAIMSGAGSRAITVRTGPAGSVGLSIAVTDAAGCGDSGTATIAVNRTANCPPVGFFVLPPCRVFDTRAPAGPIGGPSITTGVTRTFPVSGVCGVPADATAVVGNLTVTGSTGRGVVVLQAGESQDVGIETIWFSAGQTRANNVITSLGAKGNVRVTGYMVAPAVDVILDVSGYFR